MVTRAWIALCYGIAKMLPTTMISTCNCWPHPTVESSRFTRNMSELPPSARSLSITCSANSSFQPKSELVCGYCCRACSKVYVGIITYPVGGCVGGGVDMGGGTGVGSGAGAPGGSIIKFVALTVSSLEELLPTNTLTASILIPGPGSKMIQFETNTGTSIILWSFQAGS